MPPEARFAIGAQASRGASDPVPSRCNPPPAFSASQGGYVGTARRRTWRERHSNAVRTRCRASAASGGSRDWG